MLDSVLAKSNEVRKVSKAGFVALGCLAACCALLVTGLSGCATAPKLSDIPFPSAVVAPAPAPAAATDAAGAAAPAPAPAPATATDTAGAAASAPVSGSQVVLQPYDTIRVKFLYWPELDDEQMIRPDGKISLLMVGEVEAQNQTPEGLRKELVKMYASKLNDPEINVVVSGLANNRVYVGGEVGTPGLILLQGRLTATGAIMQAGGFIESSAKKSSVVVVRQENGKQIARTLNLGAELKNAESEPFYLQPYDIVFVPRTTIVHLNEFVAQYIDGIVPKHVGFNWGFYQSAVTSSVKSKASTTVNIPTTLAK